MKFRKEFIGDQFRGFETARDSGNNIAVVRVKDVIWRVRDSRHLDAIARGIVPAGTV